MKVMHEPDEPEPLLLDDCATCHRRLPVCCGDFTNGFWCRECCPHPYDERDEPWMDEDADEVVDEA